MRRFKLKKEMVIKSPLRIVIYLRVSTDKQVFNKNGERSDDGSLEMQVKSSRDFVKSECEKEGRDYEIVEVIEDAGKSGADLDRKGFQRMWGMIESRSVDWVVASSPERLVRDTFIYLSLKKVAEKNHVSLKYVYARFGNDPAAEFLETTVASMAEFERKQTSVRLKRNIRTRLIEDGKINGASAILGLSKDNSRVGHFVICSEEVQILRRILDIYIVSESEAETLRVCSAKRIFDKEGRAITKYRLKSILMNLDLRYSGQWYLEEDDEVKMINLPHGAVLDTLFLKKAIEIRDKSLKKKYRCGVAKNEYLLAGLMHTTRRDKLHGKPGNKENKTYLYYSSKTMSFSVRADLIESKVIKRVKSYINNSKKLETLLLSKSSQSVITTNLKRDLTVLKRKIRELDNKIDNLVLSMSKSDFSTDVSLVIKSSIEKFVTERECAKHEVKSKISSIASIEGHGRLSSVEDTLKAYSNKVNDLNFKDKRALLFKIYERIEVINEYNARLILKPEENGLYEVIQYAKPKGYHNKSKIIKLYEKGWSLKQIAKELSCSRCPIRKVLKDAGVILRKDEVSYDKKLLRKVNSLRNEGHSYQKIADKFNCWGLNTLSGKGKWHPKTVRELDLVSK